jgi:CubicO group peptidase (beta-lactamase class C family)
MYIAAGELLEKVAGINWDQFVTNRIFTPLEMTSTSTSNSHFNASMDLAYPHIKGTPMEFLNYDNSGPAASINSCSDDLLKWMTMLLNKGTYKENQVLSENQYYNLTAPQTLLSSGPGEKIGGTHFFAYGLGWFMFDYEGRKVIQHGGGLPGFHSKVVLVPEDNLGYVILSNQLSGLVEALYKKILDIYLSDSNIDWAQRYHDGEKKQEARNKQKEEERLASRIPDTRPSYDLTSYTGIYEDKMYGKASIKVTNSRLSLEMLPSEKLFVSDLEHWENDTFKITFNDPFLPSGYVTFHADENGGIERFTIDLENPDFHFYKLDFMKID